jgi:hypothetical protein
MDFQRHSDLEGRHAFLSPSKYHWLNYDEEKIINTYTKQKAIQKGVELHAFAAEAIRLGIPLPKVKNTLNMYVNDGIGYRMEIEQPLFYSEFCFGTADTICFRNKLLRIHDYKSGETPGNINQLMIYAALFCLEYKINPEEIDIELRIYQNNMILGHIPESEIILKIMNKIVEADNILNKII